MEKHESRLDDEYCKPLASYRAEELDRMKTNFFGPNRAYHEARRRFVFKGKVLRQDSRLSIPGSLGELKAVLRPSQGAVMLGDLGQSASLWGDAVASTELSFARAKEDICWSITA